MQFCMSASLVALSRLDVQTGSCNRRVDALDRILLSRHSLVDSPGGFGPVLLCKVHHYFYSCCPSVWNSEAVRYAEIAKACYWDCVS